MALVEEWCSNLVITNPVIKLKQVWYLNSCCLWLGTSRRAEPAVLGSTDMHLEDTGLDLDLSSTPTSWVS